MRYRVSDKGLPAIMGGMTERQPDTWDRLNLREKATVFACGSVLMAQFGFGIGALAEELQGGPSDPQDKQVAETLGAISGGLLIPGLLGGTMLIAAAGARQYRRDNG